jgi:hypothetical protein
VAIEFACRNDACHCIHRRPCGGWTGLENLRELKMYPQHRLPNPLESAAAEKSAKPSLE